MCGIIGFFNIKDPFKNSKDMMTALQYRGEQSSGLTVATRNGDFLTEKALGLSSELFRKIESNPEPFKEQFLAGVGHLRYGTAGNKVSLENAQPFDAKTVWGQVSLSHNGDTPNIDKLKNNLRMFRMTPPGYVVAPEDSDTKLLLKYIEFSQEKNSIESVKQALRLYEGTYALVLLIKDIDGVKLIATRDRYGNRPLSLGTLDRGFVVASENSAFEIINAKFIREIEPGEILVISEKDLESHPVGPTSKLYHCIYEHIYFGFPFSTFAGIQTSEFREELGRQAAGVYGCNIKNEDVIANPPDSSNFFADGFCRAINRPLERIFLRRHFRVSGLPENIRSFTQESPTKRDEAIRKKFSINQKKVAAKRVWLLDDSIVRGKTSKKLVRSLKANGATWVGVILSCPPITGPCKKGIDLNDLIATENMKSPNTPDVEAIKKEVEADFLGYLPIENLYDVVKQFKKDPNDFCFGCFKNEEPIWKSW